MQDRYWNALHCVKHNIGCPGWFRAADHRVPVLSVQLGWCCSVGRVGLVGRMDSVLLRLRPRPQDEVETMRQPSPDRSAILLQRTKRHHHLVLWKPLYECVTTFPLSLSLDFFPHQWIQNITTGATYIIRKKYILSNFRLGVRKSLREEVRIRQCHVL